MFTSLANKFNRLLGRPNPVVETVRARPWEDGPMPDVPKLPSMLNRKEMKLLYWLTSEFYSGRGAIAELGTFLGSSTAHLSEGLLANKKITSRRIHSYDLYCAGPFEARWLTERYDVSAEAGYNFRHLFDENVAKYSDILNVHEGDVCAYPWDRGNIEILFVDLCKQPRINDFVISSFFPHLAPGSLLIQQDYLFGALGWLHVTMEILCDYAIPVADTDTNSVVFYIRKKIPQHVIERCMWGATSFEEKIELMDRAIAKLDTPKKQEIVGVAKDKLVERWAPKNRAA